MPRRELLMLLALAGLGFQAPATTWYVEKDGSGDFTVIQDALDAAAAGDSVRIGPGRFEDFHIENFQSGGTGAMIMVLREGPLTIIGSGRDSTIVGPLDQMLSYEGFITGGFANDVDPPAAKLEEIWFDKSAWPIQLQGRGPIVFERCRFSGGNTGQIALLNAESVSFEDSEFLGTVPDGGVNAIASFLGGQNDSLQIRNCRFRWGDGIVVTGSSGFVAESLRFEDVGSPFLLNYVDGIMQNVDAFSPGGNAVLDIRDSNVQILDSYFGDGSRNCLLLSSNSSLQASRCHFGKGSDYTLFLASNAVVSITESNILHQATYTVRTLSDPVTNLIWNFENNYWGSNDSTEIASWILDGRDPEPGGSERPIIDFIPFIMEPITVSTSPISLSSLKALFAPQQR